MTMWRMRIACWTIKATNTHSEYVILITSEVPRNVVRPGGGCVKEIELRTERTGIWGRGSPPIQRFWRQL